MFLLQVALDQHMMILQLYAIAEAFKRKLILNKKARGLVDKVLQK